MISVIICSIQNDRFAAVAKNYKALLKDEPHEIIRIHDARSLSEGYNRGIAASHGDILVFSHDDIEILTPDFASRLKEHLQQYDVVGVAGTSRLIRGGWLDAGPPFIFGQVAQPNPQQQGFIVCLFGAARIVPNIQAMDGLFFAARRSVIEKVQFDAKTFDGFHLYDLDFTYAAASAGFKLGVCNDIHILHSSWGKQDHNWHRYANQFRQKYAKQLFPMIPRNYSSTRVFLTTKQDVMEFMTSVCPA